MQAFRYILIICFLVSGLLQGCKKDPSGIQQAQSKFSWTKDGVTTIADSVFTIPLFNNFYGKKNDKAVWLWSNNVSVGTYLNGASVANITYKENNNSYSALSGSITITQKTGDLIKGFFSASIPIVGVDTFALSGTFENIFVY